MSPTDGQRSGTGGRKLYYKPELQVYGDLRKITLAGGNNAVRDNSHIVTHNATV